MATTPSDPRDEELDVPPTADEPGPHDVPDDEVIDKTLPASGSTRESGDSDSRPR